MLRFQKTAAYNVLYVVVPKKTTAYNTLYAAVFLEPQYIPLI